MKRACASFFLSILALGISISSYAVEKGIDFVYEEGEGKLNHVKEIKKLNILSNLHVPKAIFMGITNEVGSEWDVPNSRFAADLYKIIYSINKKNNLEDSIYGMNQSVDFVATGTAARLKRLKKDIKESIGSSDALKYLETITLSSDKPLLDRWFQDWGEFVGYSQNDDGEPVYGVYYVNRNRGLKEIVQEISKMLDVPFITSDSNTHSTGDFGGNLEITPDGVVFFGDTMTESQVDQIRAKSDHSNMAELKTSWLAVGHVDEMFSVIPSLKISNYPESYNGTRSNYGIVAADPIYGLNIIHNYKASNNEYISYASKGLTDHNSKYYIKNIQKAIRAFLTIEGNFKLSDLNIDSYSNCIDNDLIEKKYCDLIKYNIETKMIIEKNILVLESKTPTSNDNIIRVPQLYRLMVGPDGKVYGGISFLPGTANMVVIRDNLIVPNPTFRPFKDIVENILNKEVGGSLNNSKISFIMEKREYHDLWGEVHCGTNVMREPLMIIPTI